MNSLLRSCAVFALCFCGCVLPPTAPRLEQQQEALRLIDEGTLLLRAGELEQARATFLVAFEVAPGPAALDGLGCTALAAQDFQLAERYFLETYELDPEYTNVLGNAARLYELWGDAPAAAELYRRAIVANPENFRFRNNFGGYLIDTNLEYEVGEGRAELRKAAALYPHPAVLENLERQQ